MIHFVSLKKLPSTFSASLDLTLRPKRIANKSHQNALHFLNAHVHCSTILPYSIKERLAHGRATLLVCGWSTLIILASAVMGYVEL